MKIKQPKFRAKVKWNGNHRFSGDWIYGNLLQIPIYKNYNSQRIIDKWVWAIQEHCPNNGLKYLYEAIEIDENTIGRFTELKDVNGVEIYDNDVFEEEGWEEEYYKVYFEYGCFKAERVVKRIYSNNNRSIEDYRYSIHVVGNIHDNPELLFTIIDDDAELPY